MQRLHFPLLAVTALLQPAWTLKIISLTEPYLAQSSSTVESGKEQDVEALPLYRDLPPFMKAATDLTEALEATRRLMIIHPPFDDGDFLARLKKAAVEYRAEVIGEPPNLFGPKTGKSGTTEKEKEAEQLPKPKHTSHVFQAVSKGSPSLLQDTSIKKLEVHRVDYAGNENETVHPVTDPTSDVSGEDPFEEVQVQKLAIEEGEVTGLPIPDTTESSPPSASHQPELNVGVKVEAPYTHVQVKRGSNNGHSRHGAEVGVRVEAPFTNVKVRKSSADIPADGLPDPNGGGGGSYPDLGVRVEAPFVRVKVDGPALHHVPGGIDEAMVPGRKNQKDHPRRSGQPLNLDINIPGIFNLKLLRDETGRGRLGIGVLPVFSSLVNPHKGSDHYPGPPGY